MATSINARCVFVLTAVDVVGMTQNGVMGNAPAGVTVKDAVTVNMGVRQVGATTLAVACRMRCVGGGWYHPRRVRTAAMISPYSAAKPTTMTMTSRSMCAGFVRRATASGTGR